jgi:predicted Rossmann-fold nucleotide-binding protein
MSTFSIRRTALIWNSRAIAVFPGGMGTINELFEAWVGACDGKVVCPIAVVPNSFYKPLLDSIEHVAVEERKLIKASDFHLVLNAGENVDEAVQLLIQPMRYKDSGTQFTLREKLIYLRHELGRGITAVSRLDPAVIVMGSDGDCLSESDREVQFLSDLTTSLLNKTSFGIRLGVAGMIHNVVTKTAQRHHNRIQRILMTEAMGFIEADAYFESRSAHCETLLCNAKAAVFFPSDLPALNVLFALVCEIQTRRRRRMHVFLVGREYWQPIFDVSVITCSYSVDYISVHIHISIFDSFRDWPRH